MGKSNILRALDLAFRSLKERELFLPDTMFYQRNVYKPIQISINLILDEAFDTPKIQEKLSEIISGLTPKSDSESTTKKGTISIIKEFLDISSSFSPRDKVRLNVNLDYNEDISDVSVVVESTTGHYKFDYIKLIDSYNELNRAYMRTESGELSRDLTEVLASLGEGFPPYIRGERTLQDFDLDYLSDYLSHVREKVLRDPQVSEKKKYLNYLYSVEDKLKKIKLKSTIEPYSEIFNIIKGYFDKISDNFILIPNKEYFIKGPYDTKDGEEIEIFEVGKFEEKLLSLIESPSKTERKLIQEFNKFWSQSYQNLGAIELWKFRDELFAIFDSGYSTLPIESQGLGIQDVFLYLAHMTLFESTITAIEEPEGGLSTENQKIFQSIEAVQHLSKNR